MNEGNKIIIKNFLSSLFVINFIACFFCYTGLKFFGLTIPCYFVTMSVFLISFFILSPFYSKKIILDLLRKKSFFFLVILTIWIIIDFYINSLMGYSSLKDFGKYYTSNYVYPSFFTILAISLGFPTFWGFKKLNKLFLFLFYLISLLGIIDVIGKFLDIRIINYFFGIISNLVPMARGMDRFTLQFCTSVPRATGIFEEAQYLAMFIVFSLPVIFFYAKSKEIIFNNISIDKFLKKVSIPLATITVILTQSPVWIIFYFILFLFLLSKTTKLNYKKLLIILMVSIPILLGILMNLNFERTFLSRIIIVLQHPSLADLVIIEGSLATRISGWTNQFIIFLNHPLLGVGFSNMPHYWYDQLLHSPIPITQELYFYAINNEYGGGSPLLIKFLCETGIIGTIFLYCFLFYLYRSISKTLKFCTGIEKNFIQGLKYFIFLLIVTSWYDSTQITPILWVYLGCAQAMVLCKKRENNEHRRIF